MAGLAMLTVGASGAHAAGVGNMAMGLGDHKPGSLVLQVHSLREAKQRLYGLGYYDVHVERTSLPYSFTACKRGARYHIHVDYYGDLVQVDEAGACRRYDDDYDDDYRGRSNRWRRNYY